MNINVSITENYRLTSDDRQYSVQRRHIVDPTRAPGWEARVKAALLAGEDLPDSSTREEWRDDNGYYSLNHAGFVCAVDHVIRRTAGGDAGTLAELVAAYKAEYERLNALLKPETVR